LTVLLFAAFDFAIHTLRLEDSGTARLPMEASRHRRLGFRNTDDPEARAHTLRESPPNAASPICVFQRGQRIYRLIPENGSVEIQPVFTLPELLPLRLHRNSLYPERA